MGSFMSQKNIPRQKAHTEKHKKKLHVTNVTKFNFYYFFSKLISRKVENCQVSKL